MLTKMRIRNFKLFDDVEVELANPVVFIGPNNSGKTSAMQALALWNLGLKRWLERRGMASTARQRTGVVINRNALIAVPVPEANGLWRGRRMRTPKRGGGTTNILIDIIVEGITEGEQWECGLEFDFANSESFYVRPLHDASDALHIPEAARNLEVAFLPPMSGLAAAETLLPSGAVDVRVGEGRTAEVLRNLCYIIHNQQPNDWKSLVEQMDALFGVQLGAPQYIAERGEITLGYREKGVSLDLSSSGRGLQQTLLLLAYLYTNRGAVLLLDEPDAHLEILRQRQIYKVITEAARESGTQIVIASHSEVLLNEAAVNDLLVAFIGPKPHRVDDRGSQAQKALRDIGFQDYAQALQTGWAFYLEGATDLAILRAFAERIGHSRAQHALERPYVSYIANHPAIVNDRFYGLREGVPHLKGVALFDRLDSMPSDGGIRWLMWERREIENYLCTQATLKAYAAAETEGDRLGALFAHAGAAARVSTMCEVIAEMETARATLNMSSPWSHDLKVSDEFLTQLFEKYFERLGLPNLMNKTNFHTLVPYVPLDEIPTEVGDKLDAIAEVAESAQPA